jgi:serine protease AprX
MAGLLDDYHGMAPGAEYVLIQSENGSSEYIVEEYAWIAAAEYADYIGADIINSSLGYSEFDWPEQNHSVSDMDGNTTIISQGAGMAFNKGILVVTSAGNEGSSSWQYVTAPADQPLAMTVGSVDSSGILSGFSSTGLPEHHFKPNVVACGEMAAFVFNSTISQGNGTSFSSPVIAGAAAVLFQAFPTRTNQEIFDAIIQSSSSYPSGDNYTGYGIPNFFQAYAILNDTHILPQSIDQREIVNTYSDKNHNLHIYVYSPESEPCEIYIYNLQNQLIDFRKPSISGMVTNKISFNLGASSAGQLMLVNVKMVGFDKTEKVFIF